MISDFPVMLDACVLVQAAVRDTLLRLAERRLFLCRWSDMIVGETVRTLTSQLGLSPEQAEHFISELKEHFADAWVSDGYKRLIPAMCNHEKDRHVLAAAIKGGCEVVVTYNLKHFPEEILQPLDIYTRHPDEFLIDLYTHKPDVVVHVLHEQGDFLDPKRTLPAVLASLDMCACNKFSKMVRENLGL